MRSRIYLVCALTIGGTAAIPASSEAAGFFCGRQWITFPADVEDIKGGVYTVRRERVLQLNGFPDENRYAAMVITRNGKTHLLTIDAATHAAMIKCLG